jgi:hypothetical protein
MDNIPPMFRRLVGEVMHDVRKKMIGVTKNSNQHQRFSTGAHNFPWATEEYEWRRREPIENYFPDGTTPDDYPDGPARVPVPEEERFVVLEHDVSGGIEVTYALSRC